MLRIYVDAATKGNPGESGGGIVYLTDQSRQQLHVPLGIVSNHEAEFKVLIEALKKAIANEDNQQTVLLHSDSKIVVQTIEKNYAKNEKYQPYLAEYQQLEKNFPLLLIKWLPESQNKAADMLARQALQKFYPNKK
ncbi:TPA: ribonuclease HI family protein [Enterococcus faecalis]|uniref:ribonuclease HI family protein n=1 Tax=Enterococcus TaxID=1350 RepID=UPI000C7753D4|nr:MULTISPECIES: ribonuclease HI family protein [Enterococcus]EGO9009036.1 ribonuclease HI [Enterococcus faecalis]EHZ9203146.1 ribonuclease HI family protein [Enterococcus faecalis]EJC3746729.1 ribonuclease HI family protein [Enterococcus faecalis]MBD9889383.1 ribonuclease HI family protein [Enterococcus faecalis]MBD9925334.1 ribonuclease HI family protein [Enterococcus faecalis]